MKKLFIVSVFFLFLGIVPHVLAAPQGFTALAPIPGLTGEGQTSVINSASLADFFNNLYKYLIGLAAVLAVIQIIYGGFRIAVNKDNVSVLTDSKGKIYNAILGLVLVLSPVLVFSIINPSILNLSLNLEPLNTTTGSIAGDGGGGNKTTETTNNTPPSVCPGYTDFKWVNRTTGQGCVEILGSGWAVVDNKCGTSPQPNNGNTVCGLVDTTGQHTQVGCTTNHSGPYLETATCLTPGYASNYTCKNGLENPTITGTTKDAKGNYVGNTTAYCGKSETVTYYAAWHKGTGALLSSSFVIPRDAQIQDGFSSGCSADGGKMEVSTNKLSWSVAVNGNCPADSGVTYDPSKQTGVECFDKTLECKL